jgi:hypothetical protein
MKFVGNMNDGVIGKISDGQHLARQLADCLPPQG